MGKMFITVFALLLFLFEGVTVSFTDREDLKEVNVINDED
jgi:hypothetical protein